LKTANEIIEWAKSMECISVYALNPMFHVFDKLQSSEKTRATLIFVVNNNHCYAITDETQRRKVITTNKLELRPIEIMQLDMEEDVLYYELDQDTIHNGVDFIEQADKNVVVNVDTLEEIARAVIDLTNTFIEHFQYYNGLMVAFQHPLKNIVIIAGRDFPERKAMCSGYFKEHKVIDFRFKNQGWGQIGRLILENCYSDVPKSLHSPEMKDIFTKYPIAPYRMCLSKDPTDVTSIDKHRCYTSIFMNNNEPWNVFGAFDHVRPFACSSENGLVPGEYYIARDFYMGNNTIFISKGFYPLSFVKYAIIKQYIECQDLTYAIFADRHIKADTFKKFAEDMYETFPDDSKKLINMFIGCMGSLYHRTSQTGITTDFDTAVSTITNMEHAQMYDVDGLFVIQQNKEFMKDGGDMQIYRQVIASSIIELDKMVAGLNPEEIVCYNTDSIKIRGSYSCDVVKYKCDCLPGEYHQESKVILNSRSIDMLDRFEEYSPKNHAITRVSESQMDMSRLLSGGLVLGMPGCGKSELIVSLMKQLDKEEKEKTVVLSYTNASVENLRNRKIEAQTLSSLLWNGDNKLMISPLAKYKRVILDEFSMLPPYEMSMLLNAQQQYNLNVICVGDQNQCKAPVDNWVRYDTNPLFLNMCNNYVVTMEYKPGFARYDTNLYDSLREFLINRTLKDWKCDQIESYRNICYTNKMRKELNDKCLQRWVKEHDAKIVQFGFPVCVGLEVMAYDDADKDREIFKTQVWTIKAICKDEITLHRNDKTIVLNLTQFKSIFDYSFALTVHKCQGITINGHYNIYESEKMPADVLYTAMSRGTKKEYIHIVSKKKTSYYETYRSMSIETKCNTVNLKQGRIYRIKLSNGSIYIGKTNKSIEERFAEHKSNPTNEDMLHGLDELATIKLVEEFFYKDEKTFRDTEAFHIARAIAKGFTLANKQLNTKASKEKPIKQRVAKKPTIAVGEDKTGKRFVVKLMRKGIDNDDRLKRFPWGNDKEKAYADAVQHREHLLHKYF
jgi:hypothetical protein